ncbi:MAG: CpaF family protein [Acidimicrobiia bacterium]|nr:CpaF family protein [Acidimicrobiia bacterium]
MDVSRRIADRLLDGDTPLERGALTAAAFSLLPEEAPLGGPADAIAAVDSLIGLGPVERLLRDPEVTDVLVNAPDEVWVERNGELELTDATFRDADDVRAAIERVIAPLGLRIDHASPAVDARLPDGSRLHAAIPPIAVDGPIIAVRRFTPAIADLAALVGVGAASAAQADTLRSAVVARRSIVVSGGTGSGKTTLLNVLSGEIPAGERVVTVEDAAELRLEGHVVRLEARAANSEGIGLVTVRDLVRHALRLRPDRIVVGEVRGPEALDMIQAMSTGHDGSLSTVHANSPTEALWRLETLAMSGDHRAAGATVRNQLRAAVDLIVQMERRDGHRRISEIEAVA